MAPSARDQQPYVPGLGQPFVTPTKKRRGHPANRAPVEFFGRSAQLAQLQQRLHNLQAAVAQGSSSGDGTPAAATLDVIPDVDHDQSTSDHPPSGSPTRPATPDVSLEMDAIPSTSSPRRARKRPVPQAIKSSLYERWKALLPDLVDPLLGYLQRSAERPVGVQLHPIHSCQTPDCATRSQDVLILFWDHYETVCVPFCDCISLPRVLVTSGMFPTSPSQTRTAVSIDLLDLYLALFERSGDAVMALARALRKFYTRRGWRITDSSGAPLLDPFRKPLGHAVQWYDSLRIIIERRIESTIDKARMLVSTHLHAEMVKKDASPSSSGTASAPKDCNSDNICHASSNAASSTTAGDTQDILISTFIDAPQSITSIPTSTSIASPPPPLDITQPALGSVGLAHQPATTTSISIDPSSKSPSPPAIAACASILQRRCPACFGGDNFGRSFDQGADIVVAVDGNFSHHHMRKAGDGPMFYDPEYFIPKEEVDKIGTFIDQQRKKPTSKAWVPKVPDEAIDSCKAGHEAADEQKAKTNAGRFDDTGVMALICSHDIPLFLANIDTPGEQQKYALTLIIWLFKFLPSTATVCALYDIGCVTERSIGRYDLLPLEISSRLMWALSVMHAYGHEWTCQLIYNPRLRPGLGLRDGEGVERLWSRLRVFIAVTRTSARSRRIWILDRQAHAIGLDMRDNLGTWITRKLKNGVHIQYTQAREIVVECGVQVVELRRQWALQQAAQLSVRSYAPKRVQKEVDAVLALQQEIDRVAFAIKGVFVQFKNVKTSPRAKHILTWLQGTSNELSERAEKLYTSLNMSEMFPELKGASAEFVRMLLLAHDIKINIRKRVIAQLLEFDRIDRAAGGKDNPLGTKLHQQTRKAISKRQPAIITAIHKFNKYCTSISQLAAEQPFPPRIPLPQPLSTDLNALRDDPNLYEDVWITAPTHPERPCWLEDADVRKSIRALLKMDRCIEEEARLVREAKNMSRWFGQEMAATVLAMRLSENASYDALLQQRHDDIALLQQLWVSPLLPQKDLQERMAWATKTVHEILLVPGSYAEQPEQRRTTSLLFLPIADDDFEDTDDLVSLDKTVLGSEYDHLSDDIDNLEMLDVVEELQDGQDDPDDEQFTSDEEPLLSDERHLASTDLLDELNGTADVSYDVSHSNMDIDNDTGVDAAGVDVNDDMITSDGSRDSPDATPPQVTMSWKVLDAISVDPFDSLHQVQYLGYSARLPCSRILPRTPTSSSVLITPDDYDRLAHPEGLLNSDCINGCAILLQHHISSDSAQTCAIFSTYDTVSALAPNDGGALLRSVKRIPYIERDFWIIPIHRPAGIGHWTLVVVDVPHQTLYHFDSFADQATWQDDIHRAWTLVLRLCDLAAMPAPRGQWQAVPLATSPLQRNGVDCGVWVLAVIMARLRGYQMTSLREDNLQDFRNYLCFLVTQLAETNL